MDQYMIYPLYQCVEDVRTWLSTLHLDDPDNYDLGIVLKDSGELIGSGGLVYRPENDVWMVGYNLRADQWGSGYVVEAISGIMEEIRKTRTISAIEGVVAVDNHRSIRVMEKLGMAYVEDASFDKLDGSAHFAAKRYRRSFE